MLSRLKPSHVNDSIGHYIPPTTLLANDLPIHSFCAMSDTARTVADIALDTGGNKS